MKLAIFDIDGTLVEGSTERRFWRYLLKRGHQGPRQVVAYLTFWLRYLPRHDWPGTIWHVVLITLAAAASFVTYRLAQRTLREIAHPAPDTYVGEERSVLGHVWSKVRRYRPSRTMSAQRRTSATPSGYATR